jgi:hypothetical protein
MELKSLIPNEDKNDFFEEIINEAKFNLVQFLTREEPETGLDLLLKGHEKVATFLCTLDIITDSLTLDFLDRLWINKLNHWSLKIMSMLDDNDLDKHEISQLSRLILELAKPTLFNDSGKAYLSAVILDNLHHPGFHQNDINWLPMLWCHRDVTIRIMGFQIASTLATRVQDAKMLISLKLDDSTQFWTYFIEVIQDRCEACQVKENAMLALTNLLKLVRSGGY